MSTNTALPLEEIIDNLSRAIDPRCILTRNVIVRYEHATRAFEEKETEFLRGRLSALAALMEDFADEKGREITDFDLMCGAGEEVFEYLGPTGPIILVGPDLA